MKTDPRSEKNLPDGMHLCSRYAYPPNSFDLCGPPNKKDLIFYSQTGKTDKGTEEILEKFSTLYPYLKLISYENDIRNPFSRDAVEAYWIGNKLLYNIPFGKFASYLSDTIKLKKRARRKSFESLIKKIPSGATPNHNFHVLNIYNRTGHNDNLHSLFSMDACRINWGEVKKLHNKSIDILTQKLIYHNSKLILSDKITRNIKIQGDTDNFSKILKEGDFVSYHWGYFCAKLNRIQLKNLIFFTKLAINLANKNT